MLSSVLIVALALAGQCKDGYCSALAMPTTRVYINAPSIPTYLPAPTVYVTYQQPACRPQRRGLFGGLFRRCCR